MLSLAVGAAHAVSLEKEKTLTRAHAQPVRRRQIATRIITLCAQSQAPSPLVTNVNTPTSTACMVARSGARACGPAGAHGNGTPRTHRSRLIRRSNQLTSEIEGKVLELLTLGQMP